ncbi:hypothetical protein PR048_026947 [Dryococelus australis]|uniref:Uncharacterized protein n=1 Tax=Dryococelus australis TaxID=614101 RepID=A0ABQ9GMS4_9NEOP|nr:hypothetical protein PR048_026947 [Dryococelus australis]
MNCGEERYLSPTPDDSEVLSSHAFYNSPSRIHVKKAPRRNYYKILDIFLTLFVFSFSQLLALSEENVLRGACFAVVHLKCFTTCIYWTESDVQPRGRNFEHCLDIYRHISSNTPDIGRQLLITHTDTHVKHGALYVYIVWCIYWTESDVQPTGRNFEHCLDIYRHISSNTPDIGRQLLITHTATHTSNMALESDVQPTGRNFEHCLDIYRHISSNTPDIGRQLLITHTDTHVKHGALYVYITVCTIRLLLTSVSFSHSSCVLWVAAPQAADNVHLGTNFMSVNVHCYLQTLVTIYNNKITHRGKSNEAKLDTFTIACTCARAQLIGRTKPPCLIEAGLCHPLKGDSQRRGRLTTWLQQARLDNGKWFIMFSVTTFRIHHQALLTIYHQMSHQEQSNEPKLESKLLTVEEFPCEMILAAAPVNIDVRPICGPAHVQTILNLLSCSCRHVKLYRFDCSDNAFTYTVVHQTAPNVNLRRVALMYNKRAWGLLCPDAAGMTIHSPTRMECRFISKNYMLREETVKQVVHEEIFQKFDSKRGKKSRADYGLANKPWIILGRKLGCSGVVRLLATHEGELGSISGGLAPGIFACGNCVGQGNGRSPRKPLRPAASSSSISTYERLGVTRVAGGEGGQVLLLGKGLAEVQFIRRLCNWLRPMREGRDYSLLCCHGAATGISLLCRDCHGKLVHVSKGEPFNLHLTKLVSFSREYVDKSETIVGGHRETDDNQIQFITGPLSAKYPYDQWQQERVTTGQPKGYRMYPDHSQANSKGPITHVLWHQLPGYIIEVEV